MTKEDIILDQTCEACPEQYNAFYKNEQVGYLRLRYGYFTVECPDVGGKRVLETEPIGDGCFYPDERDFYLDMAKEFIIHWYKNNL